MQLFCVSTSSSSQVCVCVCVCLCVCVSVKMYRDIYEFMYPCLCVCACVRARMPCVQPSVNAWRAQVSKLMRTARSSLLQSPRNPQHTIEPAAPFFLFQKAAATKNVGAGAAGIKDRAGGAAGHAKFVCPLCKMQAPSIKNMEVDSTSFPNRPFCQARSVDSHRYHDWCRGMWLSYLHECTTTRITPTTLRCLPYNLCPEPRTLCAGAPRVEAF